MKHTAEKESKNAESSALASAGVSHLLHGLGGDGGGGVAWPPET